MLFWPRFTTHQRLGPDKQTARQLQAICALTLSERTALSEHMVNAVGCIVIVPAELKNKILREGYWCSRRHRVPCSRNRKSALQAYQQYYPGKPYAILEIVALPKGTDASVHKGGIKINSSHLPWTCLSERCTSPTPQRSSRRSPKRNAAALLKKHTKK